MHRAHGFPCMIASLLGCAVPAAATSTTATTATTSPGATGEVPVSAAGWGAFEANGAYGFKDPGGAVVVPAKFQMAFDAEGALACAVASWGWVCLDGRGHEFLRPYVFDNGPDPYVDDRARFVEGGKIGFYDRRGVKVIAARFEYATQFAEERAAYCEGCKQACAPEGSPCSVEGGRWGVIDPEGRALTPAVYQSITPYEGGVARAIEGGAEVRLDRAGKVIR